MELIYFIIVVSVVVALGLIWASHMKKQEQIENAQKFEMEQIRLNSDIKL